MTDWRPSGDTGAAARRAEMLGRARDYFAGQDVLSVDTPAIGPCPSADSNIASFSLYTESGDTKFLQSSPENFMKRLLAAGYPDIYSICRVFRDGERGRRHCPEFTMIEWYRLGFDLNAIVDDTATLVATCLGNPAMNIDVARYDYAEAFTLFANLDVFAASIEDIAERNAADSRLKKTLGQDRQGWLDLTMNSVVAPQFAADRLTVVQHYPADQAALARLCPIDDRVADRFEIFCGDLEIANGYVELTDAVEQRQRFERSVDEKYIDEALLACLESGLPDCAGVAVGVERLQMVLDQTDDVQNVVTFSVP